MTSLRAALDDYLVIRHGLGFAMPQDGRLLAGFVEFLDRAGAERITTELALQWARMRLDADPSRWGQRLGVARGFARHLATIDSTSEVPFTDLLPGRRPRIAPYIYSEAQIVALMAAAGQLAPLLRATRHQSLIGLLAVTGMRPAEALGLDRQDVDLTHGVVHVRAGKQKKQRELPLHESTTSALGRYARQRDADAPITGVLLVRERTTDGPRGTQPDVHPADRAGRPGGSRRARSTSTLRFTARFCGAHAG